VEELLVRPDTLARWHRELWGGRRRRHSRRPGRPPLDPSIKHLILRLGRENPRWGYLRIRGELLKLGIDVSATIIATVLRKGGIGPAPRRIGQTWSQFLRLQAYGLLSRGSRFDEEDGLEDLECVTEGEGPAQVGDDSATTDHDDPSMKKLRPVRSDGPSNRWPLGRVHPCLRSHHASKLALATARDGCLIFDGPKRLPLASSWARVTRSYKGRRITLRTSR
jgi:hypothetical protein